MVKQKNLGRLCKERMVDEIASRFEGRPNFIVTSYTGLSNQELELLRRSLRKVSSSYFVVKNAILKKVLDKLKLKSLTETAVEGGVGVSLSGADVISTCKALVNFAKEHGKLQIKTAVIDGRSISLARIKELASLPTRDVLLGQVTGGIKSPIIGFVNVLAGVLKEFVYVVDAIKNSKKTVVAAEGGSATNNGKS